MANPEALRISLVGDGSSKHLQNVALELVKRGHAVQIISGSRYGALPQMTGVEVHTFSSGLPLPRKVADVRRALRRFRADVMHSHFVSLGGYLGFLTGFHPHITSAWGDDVWLVPHSSVFHRLFMPLVLRSADQVLPVSTHLHRKIESLASRTEGVEVFQWGVDTDFFRFDASERQAFRKRLGLDDSTLLIFSPRLLSPEYNHHLLLEAWAQIRSKVPTSRILLKRARPEPRYLQELEAQIERLGLKNDVIWVDELSLSELKAAYCASDVIASLSGTDGAPLTVQEAMACERVLFAADTLGSRDWVIPGKTGVLTQLGIEDLSKNLLRLLQLSGQDRQSLSRAARAHILEKADRRRCFDRLEQIYGEVARSRGGWVRSFRKIAGF